MARAPRRSFAAPLVVTVAALPALAGCPSTVDHRTTNPPAVTTEPDRDHTNDPPPTATPDQAGGASWKIVVQNDGTCVAAVNTSCAPGRPGACNPPRPVAYTCPPGAENEHPYIIQQQGADDCVLSAPMPACPQGAMCNPPPPQKTDCPH